MLQWLWAEIRRVGNTTKWSYEGWASSWANEKSLRQWTSVNIASAILAFSLDLTTGERATILALGLILLAAELMNTAVEEVVDYISTEQDPRAKRAKDAASAAVAVTALAGGVAWLVILIG